VLDFPTRKDFAREITTHHYDIIGISSIIVNVVKVREMCRMIRKLSPDSTIVVGGHVAAIPGIEKMIDADHIVKGEGVSWMRRYLGQDESAPIRHPAIVSGMRTRIMGIRLPERKGATAATIIPSVGCPMGCNFCTTSAFFGGKGKFVNFRAATNR
jgi:tRNA A37 methylthiotransferase MiaB